MNKRIQCCSICVKALVGLLVSFSIVWPSCSSIAADRKAPLDGSPFAPLPKVYDVQVERSHMIPMRDGVRLSADIYFPIASSERAPVIYIATPYGKQNIEKHQLLMMYAEQGYITVVQDLRGKHESEGQFVVSHDMPNDLSDTANWIAKQNWSDGNDRMLVFGYEPILCCTTQ